MNGKIEEALVQLEECRPFTAEVVGSSPTRFPKRR